jgi:hypothetical protein
VRYLHHQADNFRSVSRNALGWRRADRASFSKFFRLASARERGGQWRRGEGVPSLNSVTRPRAACLPDFR